MSVKRIIVVLLVVWGMGASFYSVQAETDDSIRDLEPVKYDRLKFKQNTDYLHDTKKIEMKNTIPVKQLDIDFDGSKKLPERGRDISYLFQEAERGQKSTVAAKSAEIGLFTTDTPDRKVETVKNIQDEQPKSTNVRTMIFIGLIGVGIIFLFTVLLPKLVNEPNRRNKTVLK